MLEVNIRTFSEKAGKGMFLDYHEHMKLMNSDIKHEVKTFLNDPDCIRVYQYYSAFPLCLLEAKMLRRMNIGMSVCYIDKSVEEYLKTNPLPAIIKKWYLKYLVCFLIRWIRL